MIVTAAPDWLTKADAARLAGLSERTIQRAIADGELTASGGGKPGGRHVRIRRADLDAWLADRGRRD